MNEIEKSEAGKLRPANASTVQPLTEVNLPPPAPRAPATEPPQLDPQIAAQIAAAQAPQAGVPNITIVNQNTQQTPAVLLIREKSMLVAMLLTLFFGPLGMLYSTIAGAIVMFILNLIIGIPTGGIALIILWPIQLIWTYIGVRNHNAGQLRRAA